MAAKVSQLRDIQYYVTGIGNEYKHSTKLPMAISYALGPSVL